MKFLKMCRVLMETQGTIKEFGLVSELYRLYRQKV